MAARFADLVARQLSLFELDHADLLRECDEAERAYDRAARGEAEERYSDYLDFVDTGTDLLADIRDAFARTLTDEVAAEYEEAFNRAVLRRLPRFVVGIEDA